MVATLAASAAVTMGWVVDGHFDINHATLLCASSLVTATVASLILGSLMVIVVVLSRKCNLNPDNIATPIAASLGDLVTLALLASISNFLHRCLGRSLQTFCFNRYFCIKGYCIDLFHKWRPLYGNEARMLFSQ